MPHPRHTRSRRGFNLIEAAIVLGVVGLVIGGIWIAASTVAFNLKINKTTEGLFYGIRNINSAISIRDAELIGNAVVLSDAFLVSAGIFPKDWVINGTIVHPLGGTVTVQNWVVTPRAFDIMVPGLDSASCIQLSLKLRNSIVLSGGADGWQAFNIGSSSGGAETTWSSTTSLASMLPENACNHTPSNRIRMRFAYKAMK